MAAEHAGAGAAEVYVTWTDWDAVADGVYEDAWMTYGDGKTLVASYLSVAYPWRPIAHGIRIVFEQNAEQGERRYADFVDWAAWSEDIRKRTERGDFRADPES